ARRARLRALGQRATSGALLAFAWDKGSRNAKLADRYSARVLADGSNDPARQHLYLAEQVCIDALALASTSKPMRERGAPVQFTTVRHIHEHQTPNGCITIPTVFAEPPSGLLRRGFSPRSAIVGSH